MWTLAQWGGGDDETAEHVIGGEVRREERQWSERGAEGVQAGCCGTTDSGC